MTRRIQILGTVLLLQLGLAASLAFFARDSGAAFRSDENLIDLELSLLREIEIQEGDGPALLLHHEDDGWVMPSHFDFPVSMEKLDRLTDKLFGLKQSWPVGTTAVAARRFKVSDDEFERKITFRKAHEDTATLLIGSSPGFKKIHARLAGEADIYAIEFSAYEASAKAEDWEDKGTLELEPDEILRAELPDVRLIREGEAFRVSDLGAEEETDPNAVTTLLTKLSKPSFLAVLGTEDKPEYQQDTPALAYSLEVRSGGAIDYTYSKPKEGDDFVLKLSSRPEYFKASKYAVERLQEELSRDKLVRESQPVDPAEGEGDGPAEGKEEQVGSQRDGATDSGGPPMHRSPTPSSGASDS